MGKRGVTWAAVLLALALGAAGVIWVTGRGTADAAARLKDPNPAVRAAAIRDSRELIPAHLLTAALKDPDADVRLVAAQHLGYRGDERNVRALVEALGDPHAGVRREAAESLCLIGTPAVPLLCEALRSPDPHVRAEAAVALSNVAQPKTPRGRDKVELDTVLPLLRSLLKDEDAEVRRNAELALQDLSRNVRQDRAGGEQP
jgi:HEAT repeat protein